MQKHTIPRGRRLRLLVGTCDVTPRVSCKAVAFALSASSQHRSVVHGARIAKSVEVGRVCRQIEYFYPATERPRCQSDKDAEISEEGRYHERLILDRTSLR